MLQAATDGKYPSIVVKLRDLHNYGRIIVEASTRSCLRIPGITSISVLLQTSDKLARFHSIFGSSHILLPLRGF